MNRLIRIAEVENRIGRDRTQVYRAIKAGTFPPPIKDGRSSFWAESEIDAWIAGRVSSGARLQSKGVTS